MTPTTASPQAYRETTVLTATREQLVVMLYDGALRFLRKAGAAMQERQVETYHNELRRAEHIVAHLDAVLDYEHDARMASQLHDVYRFCLAHMHRARAEMDAGKLTEVGRLLGELRGSWAEIAYGASHG